MKLVGANDDAKMVGLEELLGKVNYFIGNEQKKWRTNIPTYKRVEYQNVYPGINLAFYGNQRQLEYDFVVSPGADPKAIKLAFEGADKLEMESSDLIISTASGDLRMHKPLVYQEVAGVRKEIAGQYVLLSPQSSSLITGSVGFQVAAYDSNKPLIIDPVLNYSTYLGGSGLDRGFAIAADASGNAYVTGMTNSTNFPTANPFQATFQGASGPLDAFGDAFVTKLNPLGSVVYSTYLGGSGDDEGVGIAVDADGNVYLAGDTNSSNFPLRNPIQPTFRGPNHGSGDAFVAKLNAAGNDLIYSTYLGGTGGEVGYSIALDTPKDCFGRIREVSEINAYVAGGTGSGDFPVTAGAFQTTYGGGGDVFVTKINPAGSALVYSTYLGGNDYDNYGRVAVDCSGNAYVTGLTQSTNFPVTVGAFQTTGGVSAVYGDAFVTKLTPAGELVYSTYLGGSGGESGNGIAVDASGNAYVAGGTSSSNFPTAHPIQATYGGIEDGFVAKLDATGSALIYSTYLGGSSNDGALSIAVDVSGNAYITGYTNSTNFPLADPIQATFGGGGSFVGLDTFVTKLNSAGNDFVFSTYLGGSSGGYEWGNGIAVDACGNAHVAGITDSSNFPTANPFQAAFGGFNDAFVAKLGTDANTFFHDDFNRPDSALVGNGWLDSPNNSGGNLSIRDGQLAPVGIGGSVQGIYRPFSFATPVSVSATVAESSGFGGLPRQYTAIFEIRSNGTLTSGYWLDFVRSDINYNDSLIQLGDGAMVIARFYPSIQFGPVLDLNFTFNVDGSVVGTVGQNGQTENFSFPAHAIQSTGNYFLVALSNPDGRATSSPIYHRLDNLTISGTCTPFFNTPSGTNVSMSPDANTSLTFANVTSAGNTTVTTSGSGPTAPSGFSLGDPPTYYDLTTTAVFSGAVTFCVNYNPALFVDPSSLRFLHFENNAWVDVTTSNNTSTNTICGQVTSFSVFAIVEPTKLSGLSPAKVWIGLKNSDDVGIRFDLLAEVYKGSTLVGSGQINSVAGGSSGFNNAKLDTIPLTLLAPVEFPPGSTLRIKLSVRNACTSSGKNSGSARLWYNDSAANSQFGATIGGPAKNYYLRDGFALATTPGPGPKKTIDVAAGAKCSPFKSFGTWSITP